MSNNSTKNFLVWDELVEEAKVEPATIKVSEEESLVFHAPTGAALLHIMHGLRNGDLEVILVGIAGDQWPRLQELLGGIDHPGLPKLVERLMDALDLYDDVTLVGPSGGRVTRRTPTDIQMLLNQGYRPVGEVHASSS